LKNGRRHDHAEPMKATMLEVASFLGRAERVRAVDHPN
jgi:hypothetical protein